MNLTSMPAEIVRALIKDYAMVAAELELVKLVEQKPHNPKFRGLNPSTTFDTRRKLQKRFKKKGSHQG